MAAAQDAALRVQRWGRCSAYPPCRRTPFFRLLFSRPRRRLPYLAYRLPRCCLCSSPVVRRHGLLKPGKPPPCCTRHCLPKTQLPSVALGVRACHYAQDEPHRPSAPATRRSNTPLAEILMLRNHAPSPPVRPHSTTHILTARCVQRQDCAHAPAHAASDELAARPCLCPCPALQSAWRAATAGRRRAALPHCHSSATAHGACPLDACPLDACPLDASVQL